MFETSYSLWTQVASVYHEYGRLTLATAGLLYTMLQFQEVLQILIFRLRVCGCIFVRVEVI